MLTGGEILMVRHSITFSRTSLLVFVMFSVGFLITPSNLEKAFAPIDPPPSGHECIPMDLEGLAIPHSGSVGLTVRADASSAKVVPLCAHGTISSSAWEVRDPNHHRLTLSGATSLTTSFRLDMPGAYSVKLTATVNYSYIDPVNDTLQSGSATLSKIHTVIATIFIPLDTAPALPYSELSSSFHRYHSTPHPEAASMCDYFAVRGPGSSWTSHPGLNTPQWVTVKPTLHLNLPADYTTLEGTALGSEMSREDSPFNHYSEDYNARVKPDPSNSGLMTDKPETDPATNSQVMEAEAESYQIPDNFWASQLDRVSVYGYHIFECAHDYHTEIHPIIGMVVDRARPIYIPSDQRIDYDGDYIPDRDSSVGPDGAYVPGIITDVWVNAHGGQTLTCGDSTLGPPATLLPKETYYDPDTGTTKSRTPYDPHYCSYSNPSPIIGGKMEFNIYLPKSPELTAKQEGLTGLPLPHVPLYCVVEDPYHNSHNPIPCSNHSNAATHDPIVEVTPDGSNPSHDNAITYLKVTVNLASNSETYSRRIIAGWIYPSPDNWGLERWGVAINSLTVADDGDPDYVGDFGQIQGEDAGDWRLWVNIDNVDQEWTKLIDCDNCVSTPGTPDLKASTVIDFGGRPWQTDGSKRMDTNRIPIMNEPYARTTNGAGSRTLGPDVLAWPADRGVIVHPGDYVFHMSGYEKDGYYSDNTGIITVPLIPSNHPSTASNKCNSQEDLGSGVTLLLDILTSKSYDELTSGCVDYTVHYKITNNGPVNMPGSVVLSPQAQLIYSSYSGVGTNGAELPRFPHPEARLVPSDQSTSLGSERQETNMETYPLPLLCCDERLKGISNYLTALKIEQPKQLQTKLIQIRQILGEASKLDSCENYKTIFLIMKRAIPSDIWQSYLKDVQEPPCVSSISTSPSVPSQVCPVGQVYNQSKQKCIPSLEISTNATPLKNVTTGGKHLIPLTLKLQPSKAECPKGQSYDKIEQKCIPILKSITNKSSTISNLSSGLKAFNPLQPQNKLSLQMCPTGQIYNQTSRICVPILGITSNASSESNNTSPAPKPIVPLK